MEIELSPEQPPDVAAAVEALLDVVSEAPSPWWQAGLEEALYGETAARPRNTLGADLA